MNFSWTAEELVLRVEIVRDSLVGMKVAQTTSWNMQHSDARAKGAVNHLLTLALKKKKKHLSLTGIKSSAFAQNV